MNTYNTVALPSVPISTIQRRGVGRTEWRNVIDEIIASERADMRDLARLRQLLGKDPEAMALLMLLQERKSIRMDDLNTLYHYKEAKAPKETKPAEEPLYPKG